MGKKGSWGLLKRLSSEGEALIFVLVGDAGSVSHIDMSFSRFGEAICCLEAF